MNELHLELSLGAIEALARGNELVFDVGEGEDLTRVLLRCDDVAVRSFKERIESAMLHMLPADPRIH